ncbi:helix-turn-helix domain-containing protein [Aquimarina sp. Aq78]|uniref:helix-turn-helix domain-containing protein n=1 Tax=Aquimarina sp. Aq78 TaxID=1191889 RepID=UPI000D112853|nr:helix-turn-helix domain-containing protein [Aquimarina sp. Aq78]
MASQEFITHKPSKLLEPYISFYFQQKILNNEQDGNFLYKQHTLPTGYTFIGFNFSNPIEFEICNQSPCLIDFPIYFSGQCDSFYSINFFKKTDLFVVVMHPTTISRLIKIPVNELRNSVFEADYHISKGLRKLHEKMDGTPFTDRIWQFEQWFVSFIGQAQQDIVFTDWAVAEIIKRKGVITTNSLAKALKVSERHLQRSFKERIGLCPHQYATIVKVNHIVNDFNCSNASLIDLLCQYEYHDKSHFRKQFKQLTQTTLASYLGFQNKAAQTFLNQITF